MQAELVGEPPEREQPADGIALRVEARRKRADPELAVDDADHAAADAALRRDAHVEGPVPRVVVHAAGEHHRQGVAHRAHVEYLVAGDGVLAEVREARPHACEVRGVHEDRTLPEVEIQRGLDRHAGGTGVEEEVADRAIAMPGLRFGSKHRIGDAQRPPGGAREAIEHDLERGVAQRLVEQGGDGDRACVHHRVEGAVRARVEDDGVEGVAARLHADALEHRLATAQFECEAVGERLRNRLDGELRRDVALGPEPAIDGRHRDPELLRLDARELGDVARNLSVHGREAFRVRGGEHDAHRLVLGIGACGSGAHHGNPRSSGTGTAAPDAAGHAMGISIVRATRRPALGASPRST